MDNLRDAITDLRLAHSKLNSALDHQLSINRQWAEGQPHRLPPQAAINETLWNLRRELRSAGFSNAEMDAVEKFVIGKWKPKTPGKVTLPDIKKPRFFVPTRQLN